MEVQNRGCDSVLFKIFCYVDELDCLIGDAHIHAQQHQHMVARLLGIDHRVETGLNQDDVSMMSAISVVASCYTNLSGGLYHKPDGLPAYEIISDS
eukprot:scaffold29292_cov129-Isochrysis_galbana.AAC.3